MNTESSHAQPSVDLDDTGPKAEASTHTSAFEKAAIGVFDTHEQAEKLVKTMESNGFPLRQLSIVGKGYHSEERPVGFYTAGDRVKTWEGPASSGVDFGACCSARHSFGFPASDRLPPLVPSFICS